MTRTELIAEADEAAKGGGAWTGRLFRALAKALKADEAEIDRLKAALVAEAEHHEEQADLWNSDNEFGDDEAGPYHAERARVLRAAAEGRS